MLARQVNSVLMSAAVSLQAYAALSLQSCWHCVAQPVESMQIMWTTAVFGQVGGCSEKAPSGNVSSCKEGVALVKQNTHLYGF